MVKYNGLPVYVLTVDDESIFDNVSLVDYPAIERDFIKFSAEAEVRFKMDDERHVVTGPVLIPEQLIYRRNGDYEYYVKFSKEAIEDMALKFFKDHSNTNGNVMHQVTVDGVTYFESYIINKERNIAPVEFSDLPDGTWVMSAKIENDELWSMIKEGQIRGFSIDASVRIEPEKDEIETLEELVDYLNKIK